MSGRGNIKKLDIAIVNSSTITVLNSLSKDKDHLGELVYNLIAKEYTKEGRNTKNYNEYPIRRLSQLIRTSFLQELGWRRLQASVLTDVMHNGKLIKIGKNHFRYIGDDK